MNLRGDAAKYKDMIMNTATEEIGHIEMLCTAVALNLEGGAPETESPHNETMHPLAHIKLAGQDPRQYLSAGLGAMPADANGVPFDVARDTMHQNQWLAVIEEIGDPYPVPSTFPQAEEDERFSYVFLEHSDDARVDPGSRFARGRSIDGKGEFTVQRAEPYGEEPVLGPPLPETGNVVQAEPGRFTRSVNAPAGD